MGGIFGVISKNDCVRDLYYGIDYNTHLGTKKGGMLVYDGKTFNRAIHSLENSYFRTKFEDELKNFQGFAGIGCISDNESQPLIVNSHLGKYAITSVNKIKNINEIVEKFLHKNVHFLEMSGNGVNPTEVIASLINECDTFEEGIENVYDQIKGSCTMLILTEDFLIAARDKLGRTPLILGRKDFESFAITSETTAFSNLGFDIIKYLGPGEVIFLDKYSYEQRKKPNNKMQICAFLWIYYGFPGSYYEGINVEDTRYKCGRQLAKNDDIDVDFVSGVPDSGVAHAIGYSNERKIPYKRAHVKYTPTWPRSFTPEHQKDRELVAKMKLIPIESIIKNNRMVLCDDSIVRGTQLKNNSELLFSYGAKEIHIRPASPPLLYPCEFLNFSTSRSTLDLITRRSIKDIEGKDDIYLNDYTDNKSTKYNDMIDDIRKKMKCSSLKYQKLDDLVKAIGLPKCDLCTHCWDNSSYF